MTLCTVATASTTVSIVSTSSGMVLGLMDLSANHPHLIMEEWAKQMVERRYYRHEGVGYIVKQCP